MIATQLASQSAIIDHVTRIRFQLATEITCWTVLSQNLIRIICLEPKLFQRVILEVRPIRWTGFACEILVYAWWSLDLVDKVPNGWRPFDIQSKSIRNVLSCSYVISRRHRQQADYHRQHQSSRTGEIAGEKSV